MKAFKIDVDGVTEVDQDLSEILAADVSWDYAEFDSEHDTWVHDMGLSRTGLRFADIGARRDLPLPAYVLGVQGEHTVAAKHGIETVRSLVKIHPPADYLTVPAIGLDIRQSAFGYFRPFRALVAFPGECYLATEFLMQLPKMEYRRPTSCPRFGDLFKLPKSLEDQAVSIINLIRGRGFNAVTMAADHKGMPLHREFVEAGIEVEFLDVHFPKDNTCDDPFGLDGEAAHEIAHLAKPDLRERVISLAIANGERES